MDAMTPEQAWFLLNGVLLGSLKKECRTTKFVLEAVPAEKADYKPEANSKTAMELVRHIAVAENRFLETPIHGEFNVSSPVLPDTAKTPAEIAAWYEQQCARNIEALTKLSGEELAKIIDFRGMTQLPAVLFLQFGMVHAIHHRGQLSTYLRPMGAKVPAIYGESYDTAAAKKAAQA